MQNFKLIRLKNESKPSLGWTGSLKSYLSFAKQLTLCYVPPSIVSVAMSVKLFILPLHMQFIVTMVAQKLAVIFETLGLRFHK